MSRLALARTALALLALSGCTRFVDLTRGQDGGGTDGGSGVSVDAEDFDSGSGSFGDSSLADDGGPGPTVDAATGDGAPNG